MTKEFAKLFNTSTAGQLLLKVDSAEDGTPEVRWFCCPDDRMGVCAMAIGFEDSEEGWKRADAFFASVDQSKAEELAGTMLRQVKEAIGEDQS